MVEIKTGDCIEQLMTLADCSVHCCVTSPPYFGLRDYGHAGQIGLEKTPDAYVAKMVDVFREVRRVLRNDGTLWLNLGDSYLGDKQLLGIPWRVAFALQADGWILRQDIIWHKPNPMPERVRDRCTKSHEYIFLLSKSQRYYYDQEATLEDCSPNTHAKISQDLERQIGSARANGGTKTNGPMKAVIRGGKCNENAFKVKNNKSFAESVCLRVPKRNKRSVWTVPTRGYKGAHFATFPPQLIEPCILAGCPENGTVLDPFGGSGTTGQVARQHGRNCILIELNPEYVKLIHKRLKDDKHHMPLLEE